MSEAARLGVHLGWRNVIGSRTDLEQQISIKKGSGKKVQISEVQSNKFFFYQTLDQKGSQQQQSS